MESRSLNVPGKKPKFLQATVAELRVYVQQAQPPLLAKHTFAHVSICNYRLHHMQSSYLAFMGKAGSHTTLVTQTGQKLNGGLASCLCVP